MTDTMKPFDSAAYGEHKRRLAAISRLPERSVVKYCMVCDEPLDDEGNCLNVDAHLS